MSSAVVQVRELTVLRGSVRAVDGVDLDIEGGLLTALVGPSGCGKTSFLRALAGLERPEAGSILIDGEEMVGAGRWVPPQQRQVGMVFQEGALFPHMSVLRNVLYGVWRLADAEALAQEALRVVGLAGLDQRYPDELSGGQQQRVALARALAPAPRVVLLDEPFANLDASLRERVRAEVRSILQRTTTTAVLVTHDQEEALSIADRVVVMDSGRFLQEGPPAQVYRNPATIEVARFFGEGQLVECKVYGGEARSVFGSTPSEAEEGAGWLWVRPEDLALEGEANARLGGATGRVVKESFFGHDLLQFVELDDGTTVWVRNLSSDCSGVGERVTVRVRPQALRVFPATPAEN